MPPRTPLPRKQTNASKDASQAKAIKAEQDSKAMPPPPPPMAILEPEMNALSRSLQNAAVKTAQVMRFHHDARQLNIQRHASEPPQSLQASLGRELENYDQLCDAIETHLIRAISVLQRDLRREQQRIRDEEKAAAEAAAAAKAKAEAEAAANALTTSSSSQMPPSDSVKPVTQRSGTATPTASTSHSPVNNAPGGRRPSAISISSLNRPTFPLKLDLSSQSLRMSTEDMLGSGLRSPVTLAPKSARPIDYDIMAAFNDAASVEIGLTLHQEGSSSDMDIELNPNMGNSADKPIELDMDMDMDIDPAMMTDLFGDSEVGNTETNPDVGGLFSPDLGGTGADGSDNKVDNHFLSSIGVDGVNGNESHADIFASLGVGEAVGDGNSRSDTVTLPSTEPSTAPSPGTYLASLSQSSGTVDLGNLGDLEFFSSENNSDMNLDSLWMPMPIDGNSGNTNGDPTKSNS